MRETTKYERGAMWMFSDDYATLGLSAIDFWRQLDKPRKDLVVKMVRDIIKAPFGKHYDAPHGVGVKTA